MWTIFLARPSRRSDVMCLFQLLARCNSIVFQFTIVSRPAEPTFLGRPFPRFLTSGRARVSHVPPGYRLKGLELSATSRLLLFPFDRRQNVISQHCLIGDFHFLALFHMFLPWLTLALSLLRPQRPCSRLDLRQKDADFQSEPQVTTVTLSHHSWGHQQRCLQQVLAELTFLALCHPGMEQTA